MRIDKFLKVSRLIKRRTVAKDVSDQGRVWINGRDAKASTHVKVGDELSIQFGQKKVTIRVEASDGVNPQGRRCADVHVAEGRSFPIRITHEL